MECSLDILDQEDVARILSREWVIDGVLSNAAFTLRPNETYISVNRLAIASYNRDVATFIDAHPSFSWNLGMASYRRALLHVKDVRKIQAGSDEISLRVNVEVEPRKRSMKSHAGIFTRYDGQSLKHGTAFSAMGIAYSVDDILLDVRTQLMRLARIEERPIVKK